MIPLTMIGAILLFCGFLFFLGSISMEHTIKNKRKDHVIQEGKIISQDLSTSSQLFFSKKYHLRGKPDYIVKRDGKYIPIEIKTGKYLSPQHNHVLQLAAYCHLLEETYGDFVPFGILVYSDTDQQFTIPFNPSLRFRLENTLHQMREYIANIDRPVNQPDHKKCDKCSMKKYCSKTILNRTM